METALLFILLATAALSLIPVVHLNKNRDNKKYRCLRHLINAGFFWTLLIFIERLSGNSTIIYYAHMLSFPLKFILVSLLVCTVFNYIEKPMPKTLVYSFGLFVIFEVILAFTNITNQFLIETSPSLIISFIDVYSANHGTFFIYHLIINYTVLLFGIGYLFYFLAKHRDVRQYKSITQTIAISVAVVLLFNLSQLLLEITNIDLTYVSLIVVSYSLYRVIYMKDMVFNLKASGRSEILSNMREMYIITDADHNVIEISQLLSKKYEIDEELFIGKHLDHLIEELEKDIVFYKEYRADTETVGSKDHFHLREKKFKLVGMNDYGFMILLYDETQVFSLLRELNRLSNYDNMTGLNNRNYIETKLEKLGECINLGIISLDLNGLKVNNDYLGHERGDMLLKSLANKMKSIMSSYKDKDLARIGGDEFLIVVYNTSAKVVKKIKEDILKECESADIEKLISVAIGIAFSEKTESVYTLIKEADEDMYSMKKIASKLYAQQIVEYAQMKDKYIR